MLSKITEPFLFLFYLLAQNPFPTANFSTKNKFKKLFSTLPVLVVICISVCVTLSSLSSDEYVTEFNKAREIFHVLLILSSFVANLTTAYQCIFLRQTWTELRDSLSKLETEFQDLLPLDHVELMKFRKVFIIKCLTMLPLYMFTALARIVLLTIYDKHLSYMFVLIFINNLSAFQVLFFVDLSRFCLKTIVRAVHDEEKFGKSKLLISTQKIYTQIWKTMEKINQYFGLFLLAYIVAQFLNISYDIYWILSNKFSRGFWLSSDNAVALISSTLSFLFVTNACDSINVVARNVAFFLHENDEYRALPECPYFIWQIFNQPINVTAKGFYKLDRSFFAALTVGSITSAIILVQFQKED